MMRLEAALSEIILQHLGVEYVVCDTDRHILEYSPGLLGVMSAARRQSGPLQPDKIGDRRLEDLFDELQGVEDELAQVASGRLPFFRIEHTYRDALRGQAGYLTLTVLAAPGGLLLVATNTTREAQLIQRLMQERNEVLLLQDKLKEAHAKLDYLFRRFTPNGVAEQLMAQRELPKLGGQRRTISVMFADIRGYTALSETMQPEAVMDLLNRHFGVVGNLVTEHAGTINQYAGDMLMAMFNAPRDQADHALRAVRAALVIQATIRTTIKIRDSQPSPAAETPVIVQFGIGINTGPAVVGYLGFEDRYDYTAIGDTTNVASRLSAVAKPGQVLMGPETYQAVRDCVPTRLVGPMQLKGRSKPLLIYEARNE